MEVSQIGELSAGPDQGEPGALQGSLALKIAKPQHAAGDQVGEVGAHVLNSQPE
jgi:hypothetical protein